MQLREMAENEPCCAIFWLAILLVTRQHGSKTQEEIPSLQ